MSLLQRYNCLDTIATFRLWEQFEPLLEAKPPARISYNISCAMQAPLLYMMLRGLLVDQQSVEQLRLQFEAELTQLEATLDSLTQPLGIGSINIASPDQITFLFECLGEELSGTGREALEQLRKAELDLAPICNIILAYRDRAKMLQVLQPSLFDADGRVRTFYKVAGTVTKRLSSSKNALWGGMNMQNIKREEEESKVGHASIRSVFVADPGKKYMNVDLERADSWAVGLEVFKNTGEAFYLNACASSDLHTYVSRLVWPNLGWTGNLQEDVAIAEQYFYRQYDYRFMSKKGGHGSNYLGKARTLAIQMKIPVEVATNFQLAYFEAFPGIRSWQSIRIRELQQTASLHNLFGWRRNFHGRLDAGATQREAIGFLGQSVTAEVMNRALLKVWAITQQMPSLKLEILAQVHDSLLLQYDPQHEAETAAIIRQAMSVPISVTAPSGETQVHSIPLEISVGWNWAKRNKKSPKANPDGLVKLKEGSIDDRERQRWPLQKEPHFMDRRVRSVHRRAIVSSSIPQMGGDNNDWSLSGTESLGDHG